MPLVDGIVSGLDTTALIEAILGLASLRKEQIEATRDRLEDSRDKVASIATRMQELADETDKFGSPEAMVSWAADLSAQGVVSASVGDGAVAGTWQITVNSLAKSETERSQGFASATAAGTLGQGTLQVTVGSQNYNVVIDATNDNLTEAAKDIDALDGVTAYVLDTGDPAARYRLVVQGEETGAANAIAITAAAGWTGTAPVFTTAQAATDASISVNGIQVNSSSNRVTALPGLELTLQKDGGSTVDVTVRRDDAAIANKLQAFVDKYNEVVDFYDVNTLYNPEEGINGALVGDGSVRRAMEGLSRAVSSGYSVGGSLSILAELGVSTGRDGRLTLDRTKFSERLQSSYEDVELLLTSATGPMAKIRELVEDTYVEPENGVISSRRESLEAQIADAEERIADQEAYLTDYAERLRVQFTALEQAMGTAQNTMASLSAMLG